MLDIELFRRSPDLVRLALRSRGDEAALHPVLELDARRRAAIKEGDELRARRNQVSQEMGALVGTQVALDKSGNPLPDEQLTPKEQKAKVDYLRFRSLRDDMRARSNPIKALEEEVKRLEQELGALLLTLPNLPRPDVPVGTDASANVIVRSWGEPRSFPFEPLPHWDLAERLRIIDFQRGAKLSGSRFYVLSGHGARLERALVNWMLDLHTREHGYTEIAPPALVRQEVMVGSGNLPKFRDNLYHDDEDDLWLIPTAEVPLTSLHAGEILEPAALPFSYVACTPCFRREKAAAGRDTRGIKRVHQFEKVELYKVVEPEHSDEVLERLVRDAEEVLRRLELPYRVVQLCTGDLGFPSAKSYDLEVWAPGCREWLEVSSCSNCTDFQARRANIRFRRHPGARPEFVHTLNGSGVALPRLMIALLETYQQSDGTVVVPEVLRPSMGTDALGVE
ncbi:MAG: serine--tRNA ligase [Chloroflexi bacterium]|nr:serine--tRNA ligase [Chloroflexota bacterium]